MKDRLVDYLRSKGIAETDGKFACPDHDDVHPSATVYDGERFYCPVCGTTKDIFDIAGTLIGSDKFAEQKAEVERVLGVVSESFSVKSARNPDGSYTPKQKPKTEKTATIQPVPLPLAESRKIFTEAKLLELGNFVVKKPNIALAKAWPYFLMPKTVDSQPDVVMIDARYEYPTETGELDKTVLTLYWDGKNVKAKQPPVLLYGLDVLWKTMTESDRESYLSGSSWGANIDICFHEGCKSATVARKIEGFVHMAWNGGCKKTEYADLEPLKGFAGTVYLYPDDDVKSKGGRLLEKVKQPGIQAMLTLARRLGEIGLKAFVVEPYPKAREAKADGADIVEALEVEREDVLADWIRNSPLVVDGPDDDGKPNQTGPDRTGPVLTGPTKNTTTKPQTVKPATDQPFPFICLGHDGERLCFIGIGGSLLRYSAGSLTKTQLLTLTSLTFWKNEYPAKGGVEWEQAIDDVINFSMTRDYIADRVRGCGAWREKRGDQTFFVYHDGKRQFWMPEKPEGESPNIYIKRPVVDMGLDTKPAEKKLRRELYDAVATLTWETKADCLRVMSWATLSPFCGALSWRPAGLLTGESGSGKSTIARIVKMLSVPLWLTGGESTEAGVRQSIGADSRNLVFDESDMDTEKKKQNMINVFSLMRQSTTDDAPAVVKGTMGGQATSFSMKNMYLFMSIDPEIEMIADENRMFRSKLVKAKINDWNDILDDNGAVIKEGKGSVISRLVTEENCAAVRAFTWQNLRHIIDDAPRLANIISDVTGRDIRWSTAEALLLSAYFCVWRDATPDNRQARAVIEKFYLESNPEPQRNDAEEVVERLLDEVAIIPETRENATLRYILRAVVMKSVPSEAKGAVNGVLPLDFEQIARYRKIAATYGLAVQRDGSLAIAHNHHRIMSVLKVQKGYHMRLERHPESDGSRVVSVDGASRRCVVLKADVLMDGGVPF